MGINDTRTALALGKIADIINLDRQTLEAIRVYVTENWLPNPKRQTLKVIDVLLKEE